ncbi:MULTISPECIES: TetR/AcrR family transcriptional regulator [Microbacterium]|uniref:TetR/AcrR family transcriptional regulator n=1 Tax=Microbacterium TaxID=33882 RepID=UPI0011EAFCC6|nr:MULTISPECIES: TetR family transcriptional regulator [Microbacterium]
MSSSARPYRSALRTRQAEETRARIVTAAARLFAAQGYQATTISAIAREAGVSAETVKTTAAKAELLIAAFEITFSGSEAAETLADTEAGSGLTSLPDDVFLDAVITQIGAANERGHALWTVLLGAALSDPIVDAALQRILANRAADYRGFASELQRRGIVASEHDSDALADVLSFLLSPESYQQLVVQSQWSPDRYRSWLRTAVLTTASPTA